MICVMEGVWMRWCLGGGRHFLRQLVKETSQQKCRVLSTFLDKGWQGLQSLSQQEAEGAGGEQLS